MLDHYDGVLRFVDESGNIVKDHIDPRKYYEYIGEATEDFSYLKSPYYLPKGYAEGMYRVGPLARLNVIDRAGTPKADREWAEFRALRRGVILSNFHNHYARLIEILFCARAAWSSCSTTRASSIRTFAPLPAPTRTRAWASSRRRAAR